MSTLSGMLHRADRSTAYEPANRQMDLFEPAPCVPPRVAGVRSNIDDLRRLEETIRWLQAEARGLPRVTNLAAVPGLPPPGAYGVAPCGHDGVAACLEAPALTLEPERIVPPPVSYRRRGILHGAMKLTLAGAIVATLGYGGSFPAGERRLPALRADAIVSEPDLAPPAPAPASRPVAAAREGVPAGGREGGQEVTPAVATTAVAPDASVAAREPTVAAEPGPAPLLDSTAAAPHAALAAPEVAALIERGRVHFEAGDLAAARHLFRRAANAGNAGAALAMGATYDPAVLAGHQVHGPSADVDAARTWYEKARQLGSPEGPSRLDLLAHR